MEEEARVQTGHDHGGDKGQRKVPQLQRQGTVLCAIIQIREEIREGDHEAHEGCDDSTQGKCQDAGGHKRAACATEHLQRIPCRPYGKGRQHSSIPHHKHQKRHQAAHNNGRCDLAAVALKLRLGTESVGLEMSGAEGLRLKAQRRGHLITSNARVADRGHHVVVDQGQQQSGHRVCGFAPICNGEQSCGVACRYGQCDQGKEGDCDHDRKGVVPLVQGICALRQEDEATKDARKDGRPRNTNRAEDGNPSLLT